MTERKDTGMGAMLLDPQDAIDMVQRQLDARTHWLIIGASPMGFNILNGIEEKFYDGEAGNDFSIHMFPMASRQLVALAVAHKRRMSPKQFAEYVNSTEDILLRDVVLTPDIPVSVLKWLSETFHSDYLN